MPSYMDIIVMARNIFGPSVNYESLAPDIKLKIVDMAINVKRNEWLALIQNDTDCLAKVAWGV